jgi:hypothetical protein
MDLLHGMISTSGEGNISWFGNRQDKLVELIKNIKPEYVMELGFNMGHSAILICDTIMKLKENDPKYKNKVIQFYVFDICEHETVKHNLEVLQNTYQGNFNFVLIEGDSLTTIPYFFHNNKINFDFIEIDGCHSFRCVREDVMNSWNNLSEKGVIYIDDYRSTIYNIPDVDNGVDSLDWSDFNTEYVDGVFWAIRKPVVKDKDDKYFKFLCKVHSLLDEEDPEILKFNIDYLKSLTNVLIKRQL